MQGAWSVAKSDWRSLFTTFESSLDLPWTMSFVIRKRQQIDSLADIPKEKRPPEIMIWWGKPEEIEAWFDRVYEKRDVKVPDTLTFEIDAKDIE